MEYGDEDRSDMEFPDTAERDKQFAKLMSKTQAANDAGIVRCLGLRHELGELLVAFRSVGELHVGAVLVSVLHKALNLRVCESYTHVVSPM